MFGTFGPGYSKSDAVSVTESTVLKRTLPGLGEIEAQITNLARSLAQSSDLFCVPRVLGVDRGRGVIEFERIKGFRTLGQLLARDREPDEILARAGRSLGFIHKNLLIPDSLVRGYTGVDESPREPFVSLHGDFNTINVGYVEDRGRIVVLDWASAPVLHRRITVGPRYLDMGSFLRSLLIHQAGFLKAARRFRRRTEAFLHGYETESACKVDMKSLGEFLVRISTLHLRAGSRGGAVLVRGFRRVIETAGHLFLVGTAGNWGGETRLRYKILP